MERLRLRLPGAGDRLGQLADGVEIMKQAWENGVATYSGEHYQVDGALCYPRPVQAGGIPFWVAGGGEKKTLRIAAKYASYTNFGGDVETFTRKSEILAGHCRDLGRDFGEITRSSNFNVIIGQDEAEVSERVTRLRERYRQFLAPDAVDKTVENVLAAGLVGTPEQVVEKLKAVQGLGMEYAITYFPEVATDFSGVELFQKEVVPACRKAAPQTLWHTPRRQRSAPGHAVQRFPDQVGVTVVPLVLPDQVHVDHAQREHLAAHLHGVLERHVLGGLRGERALLHVGLPPELGPGGVGPVEVLVHHRERVLHVFTTGPDAQPDPFHLGQVPDQPEQRHRGRQRAGGELLGGQPGADVQQGGPAEVEVALQHRTVGTHQRPHPVFRQDGRRRRDPRRHAAIFVPLQGQRQRISVITLDP